MYQVSVYRIIGPLVSFSYAAARKFGHSGLGLQLPVDLEELHFSVKCLITYCYM